MKNNKKGKAEKQTGGNALLNTGCPRCICLSFLLLSMSSFTNLSNDSSFKDIVLFYIAIDGLIAIGFVFGFIWATIRERHRKLDEEAEKYQTKSNA
jgi:hypothetical protein